VNSTILTGTVVLKEGLSQGPSTPPLIAKDSGETPPRSFCGIVNLIDLLLTDCDLLATWPSCVV
jgi:hypothetical protein